MNSQIFTISEVENGFTVHVTGYMGDTEQSYYQSTHVFHSIEEVFAHIRSYLK